MDPVTILTLTDALLTGIEKLAPRIAELTQQGYITVEQQAALQSRVAAISDGSAFSASYWKPRT